MDTLPHHLLLEILSRLDDSSDVARCRIAFKAFNAVFRDLRSINLVSLSSSSSPRDYHPNFQRFNKLFRIVFLHLISKLSIVESVRLATKKPILGALNQQLYLTDGAFAKEWLPRVSKSLKSLSVSDAPCEDHIQRQRPTNFLPLISAYCHNLVNLEVRNAWLHVDNLNPMPMLTSLTLASTILQDERLSELNKCFPNLQVLKLIDVRGLERPKIHLLNLQTCYWDSKSDVTSLTLITPNLTTLEINSTVPASLHLEAPMLSHLHLSLTVLNHASAFTLTKFENLKTLWLCSSYIGSILSEFPVTKTVQNLTLDSKSHALGDDRDSKFTLGKVFMVFPNVSSLCIKSGAWSELKGWDIRDGRNGLRKFCVYLTLADLSLTFSSFVFVLDQCVGLSEVSLLIHDEFIGHVTQSFKSKYMTRWPGLKWKCGKWR